MLLKCRGMGYLASFDQDLFLLLNGLHAGWLDPVMVLISGRLTWLPLYALLLFMVWRRWGWRGLVTFGVSVGVLIALADQGSVLIKNWVQRPRPCHVEAWQGLVHLPSGRCGGAFGFVSSHASNVFALALLFSLLMRRRWVWWGMFGWALLVSYSRIYLGVHYPGDVVCGAILGLLISLCGYVALQRLPLRDAWQLNFTNR